MKPSEIAEEAISKLNKRITNEIFMLIQNDRQLMYAYLGAVECQGLDTVNQQIGRAVKTAYHLTNMDDREENPECTLIQSHQRFE